MWQVIFQTEKDIDLKMISMIVKQAIVMMKFSHFTSIYLEKFVKFYMPQLDRKIHLNDCYIIRTWDSFWNK